MLRPLGDQDIVKIVFDGGHFEIQDGGRNCSLIMSCCKSVLLLHERADKSSHVFQFSHFFHILNDFGEMLTSSTVLKGVFYLGRYLR